MADTAAANAVTKAVIPAAGLGTRFLPAAKAIPKEMLPVIDIPTIQLVVEEAVAAGLRDVLMVTRRGKSAIEDHFDTADELEAALTAKGDHAGLATVRAPSNLAKMHYVRQDAPKGLGHAVLCAAEHVGNEPFAVLLGDDFIDSRDHLLSRIDRPVAVDTLIEELWSGVWSAGCAGCWGVGRLGTLVLIWR